MDEGNQQVQVRWISSLDIIDKTKISRATLNNYIKMNILPRPDVKKPGEASVRARMLGYFPETVIDIIGQIKDLKKQGYSMDAIIEKLRKTEQTATPGETIIQSESRSDDAPAREKFIQSEQTDSRMMPTLVSFCLLVADLQNSVRICAELPPEEYFELINQMWACVEGSFKQYHGAYGKHTGDGMLYYFFKERDNQYIINAVSCALEIRKNIKKLNMEWKIRRGWLNELYLNIGINEGQEYFGTIPSAPSVEFTAVGDSVNYAGSLSDFARYGAIWTTKNLMNKLTTEEKAGMRYGIRCIDQDREILVENSFSRIMDMMTHDNVKNSKFMDIATLAVTEILGRR